ncbi:hypothetical protein [Streptomyces sp. NPDC054784]
MGETPTKYERYHRPHKPDDLDAEFMTVQEAAYVLKCSVATVRRQLAALKRGGGPGRRILVSRSDRQALYEATRRKDRRRTRAAA